MPSTEAVYLWDLLDLHTYSPEQDPYLINTLISISPVHFTEYLGHSEALYTLGPQNEGSHLLPSFHADFSTSGGP